MKWKLSAGMMFLCAANAYTREQKCQISRLEKNCRFWIWGAHGCAYGVYCHLGCDIMLFQKNVPLPSSRMKSKQMTHQKQQSQLCVLKMEEYVSEMSLNMTLHPRKQVFWWCINKTGNNIWIKWTLAIFENRTLNILTKKVRCDQPRNMELRLWADSSM